MILGVGLDVVEVERIRRIVGPEAPAGIAERFVERCFTGEERRYCEARHDPATFYAARFAAKEAASKALGVPQGIRFTDVEVRRGDGAPEIVLSGAALRAAQGRGVERIHVTLTHDGGIAAAVVILEGGAG